MILSKARVSERDDQYVFFSQHSKKLYVSWPLSAFTSALLYNGFSQAR